MSAAPGDLEQLVAALGAPAGLDVVDVGCGSGRLAQALVARGARVTGVEVTAEKVRRAQAGAAGTAARFVLGRGEALGLPDASSDLVVYLRSLHHVPVTAMDGALREARRVLRDGGRLYVVEPLPEGDYHALVSLVEDETVVRAAAQAALRRARPLGFEAARHERSETFASFRDLDEVRERMIGVDPARGPVFDARRSELSRRFESGGEARDGFRVFRQPHTVDVLRAS